MLHWAVKANIPILACSTTDVLNAKGMIEELIGKKVIVTKESLGNLMRIEPKAPSIYLSFSSEISTDLYDWLSSRDCIYIMVNPEEIPSYVLNTGMVPIPKAYIQTILSSFVIDEELSNYYACCSGLTPTETYNVCAITQSRDGCISVKGVLQTRTLLAGKVKGLQLVDTDMDIYLPNNQLLEWVSFNKPFFVKTPDSRLTPRGILLSGPSGVGKSAGAKYIANEFNMPLYRINLSLILAKWVGDSESQFEHVLSMADHEEPCILLIDEVDKLFTSTDDPVMPKILAQLLWWLQEHKSRVLTILTTNNLESIPKELYRERRIDSVIELTDFTFAQAETLAIKILSQFKPTNGHVEAARKAIVERSQETGTDAAYNPAQVTQTILDLIKRNGWY